MMPRSNDASLQSCLFRKMPCCNHLLRPRHHFFEEDWLSPWDHFLGSDVASEGGFLGGISCDRWIAFWDTEFFQKIVPTNFFSRKVVAAAGSFLGRYLVRMRNDWWVGRGPFWEVPKRSLSALRASRSSLCGSDANDMWECAGMPTMGYVIGELSRARRLDAGAARALGATGQALGQLKIGNDVVSFFVFVVWSLSLICCARCSLNVCFCITSSVCFGVMCGSTRRRRATRVQTKGTCRRTCAPRDAGLGFRRGFRRPGPTVQTTAH